MTAQPISRTCDDMRFAARTHLFLSATIRFGAVSAAIRVRDLSASGARIEGSRLPAVGSAAHITRGALDASGTIMWRDSKGCGFRFDIRLPLDEWMPARAYHEQQTVDDRVAAVRSDNVERTGKPSATESGPKSLRDALPQRMAEELAYVGRLLESLGDGLCQEKMIVLRHGDKLQDLDNAGQILGHVAALLVADHPERAVDSIGMASLRKRLLRAAL